MQIIFRTNKPQKTLVKAPHLLRGKVYRCVKAGSAPEAYENQYLIGVSYDNVFGLWLSTDFSGVLATATVNYEHFYFEEFNCHLMES